jgi:hypothetical protein
MTDAHTAPAGWYPQPDGSGGQRWWDGERWTEHTSPLTAPAVAPVYAAAPAAVPAAAPAPAAAMPQYDSRAQPRVPAGTPVDTPWIWLIVALPLLPLIPLFLWDFEGYMLRSMTDPMSQLALYVDPWYLTMIGLGWVTYGVLVWLAYLDVKALRALGYVRQFHWAWTFLSSVVYVIGRSVVVKRQAGRGFAPMWTVIALNVAVVIAALVWAGVIIANVVTAAMLYASVAG